MIALSKDFLLAFSNVQKSHQKKVREFFEKFQVHPEAKWGFTMNPSRVLATRISIPFVSIRLTAQSSPGLHRTFMF